MATKTVRLYVLTTLLTPGDGIKHAVCVTDGDFSSNPDWMLLGKHEVEYKEPTSAELASHVIDALNRKKTALLGKNAKEVMEIEDKIQTWLALPNEVPHDPA